jgi:phosphate transport system permease protein
MSLSHQSNNGLFKWFKGGEPFIWLNAAAVALSVLAVVALLAILAVRGFGHFWPAAVFQANYQLPNEAARSVLGETVNRETVSIEQLLSAGFKIPDDKPLRDRSLVKLGNRDVYGADFSWFLVDYLQDVKFPENALVVERREWGNAYGFLSALKENDAIVADASKDSSAMWADLQQRLARVLDIHDQIEVIEKDVIGSINYRIENVRLQEKKINLNKDRYTEAELAKNKADVLAETEALAAEYNAQQAGLAALYDSINRDALVAKLSDGQEVTIPLSKVVRVYRPNTMSIFEKIAFYGDRLWEFLADDPREANTEGGIFPAIIGTVIMVLVMSVIVMPFGVVAAVYLREYARQGWMVQTIRIAVNNLAGVPSIVYGVFGLGFFVYFLGGNIDRLFYAESLPSPTFGTPGLMWASLTLALLTLPVVIVATEEGLSRIPRALREGSLALGATKAETLWRVVLPMSSPAIMTGLILAVARAAGEVAPLMLVGVVKLAPSLPLDGNYPYFHLDRKFMHLGFHIYDVGFQSPNVEAARPLVYATALLLVIVVALLNYAAVKIRNNLREKYKSLEM